MGLPSMALCIEIKLHHLKPQKFQFHLIEFLTVYQRSADPKSLDETFPFTVWKLENSPTTQILSEISFCQSAKSKIVTSQISKWKFLRLQTQ